MQRSTLLCAALACVAACRSVQGPRAPALAADLAPLFHEELHGFTPGIPAVEAEGDRLEGAHVDARAGRLFLDPDGGRFTSHVLFWPRPFDELLVSWNADVPEGAGMVVEVQVGRAGGAWSPWLYMGDWGRGLPLAERTTEFAGGKVAVDVFESPERWDRARYRITALPGAGGEPVAVARTSLCFTDTARLASLDGGLPPAPLVLPVPERSQRVEEAAVAGRICSPTSVAMVLASHGVERETIEVARAIYDTDHDIYGNWPRAVQAAWTFGVPGSLVRLSSWGAARHFLERGVPLVISIRAAEGELSGAPYAKTNGHLLVIVGFDAAGDVIVNDPAASPEAGIRRTYRRADLERVWMRKGGVTYAIGPVPDPRAAAR